MLRSPTAAGTLFLEMSRTTVRVRFHWRVVEQYYMASDLRRLSTQYIINDNVVIMSSMVHTDSPPVLALCSIFAMSRLLALLSLWAISVQAAVNLDGSQVTTLVSKDQTVPISEPKIYYPDQYDCPLACNDYSNVHSWIPYLTVDWLRRCQQPMLVQISETRLDNPNSNP